MTAVYPALELHWVVVLEAPSQNHYHLETPIPSSTHCLLNRILQGVGGGVWWDPAVKKNFEHTTWLIGISGH